MSDTLPPLPRRKLGPMILTLLILLRIYVIGAVPIVAYAFIRALLAPTVERSLRLFFKKETCERL